MTTARKQTVKLLRRGSLALLCATMLLPFFAFAPKADAQVSFNLQIGAPPVCPYGYYEYPPYSCAPPGFYGPGYFYNGIFLGVGPWSNWGYAHGWGRHRFIGPRGGRYYRGYWSHHEHLRPDHRWDHGPRGHAYGHYDHDRGHDQYRGHVQSRGHDEHHDNGHHGGDHGHGDHGHDHH